jgi:hypothetical protein
MGLSQDKQVEAEALSLDIRSFSLIQMENNSAKLDTPCLSS